MVGASIFWARHPALKWIPMCLWPTSFEVRSLRSPRQGATCHWQQLRWFRWHLQPGGDSGNVRWGQPLALHTRKKTEHWTWLAQLPQVQHDFHQFPYPGVSSVKLQAVPSFIGTWWRMTRRTASRPSWSWTSRNSFLADGGPKEAHGIQAALRYGPAMILGEAGAWGWSDGIFESSWI